MEHAGAGTMLTDVVSLVRDDDHRPVAPFLEQLAPAFLVEARVAHGDDFVDQEAVKLDGHRDGKGKARTHARGVGLHGLAEVLAELGELLDERPGGVEIRPVDSADEAYVVQAREASLECAAEGKGPGDGHLAGHATAVGELRATDDADERGFSGTVSAQDAELVALADFHADAVQDGVGAGARAVALDDVLQADHSPSTVTETRFALTSASSSNALFAPTT